MAKKAAKKKVTAKKAAPKKKAPAKKAAPKKKAPAKKAAPKKKAPAKKAAPKKKAPAKKAAPKKKAPAKKAAPKKKAPAKKAAPKKKAAPAKKAPAKKAAPKKKAPAKKASKKAAVKKIPIRKRMAVKKRPMISHLVQRQAPAPAEVNKNGKPRKLSAAFLRNQRQKLLDLRDTLVDQMNGVARDSLGRGEEGSDSSAFGMHQADAGSDSYDRDFALNILSQEQDALHEIEEALVRIDSGEYGICQGSGVMIPQARLEAMPFARCTVDFQEKLDQEQASGTFRTPVTSLFGLDEKEVAKPVDK